MPARHYRWNHLRRRGRQNVCIINDHRQRKASATAALALHCRCRRRSSAWDEYLTGFNTHTRVTLHKFEHIVCLRRYWLCSINITTVTKSILTFCAVIKGRLINTPTINQHTLCLKKIPTFKLYVTLSNRNRFSKFLHCWKFATKPIWHRHLITQISGGRGRRPPTTLGIRVAEWLPFRVI